MSLKIMVVDDERTSLQLVRSLAAPLQHVVLTFEDYQAASKRADTQRFDVVFVGMRAGNPAGLELARQVRNSALNRNTAMVMLSATEDIASLRMAFGVGAELVLVKPITGGRISPLLAAMDSPGWKSKKRAARMPLFAEVKCTWDGRQFPLRSLNISESGMLLQGPLVAGVGQEVALEFKIVELRASLNLPGRIVRKEGNERVAAEFTGLVPEEQNAIQLYVMGRLKDRAAARDQSNTETEKLFRL